MARHQTSLSETARSTFATVSAAIGAAVLIAASTTAGYAQAFADLKTALVDYSKADVSPSKACGELGKFKSKYIAQITATMVPADSAAPENCRVTGLLSPEIAFEV